MRILLRVSLGLVLVAALAIAGALAHRASVQRRILAETAIEPPGLDLLESVEIGGVEQKLLIRGRSPEAPVLVYLHGGPGRPFLPVARQEFGPLEEHFIVVTWAQRGTPGSRRAGMEPLTFERVVADTLNVVKWAQWRLAARKVLVVGESWGSLLGAIAASRLPEEVLGYVGVSQVVHLEEAIPYTFEWALERAREAGDREAVDELEALAAEHERPGSTVEQFLVIANAVRRLGGYAPSLRTGGPARTFVREYFAPAWFSPDYTLGEVAAAAADPLFGARVFEDALAVDLRQVAPVMEVPAYFFVGTRDPVTPAHLVESYFERLDTGRGKDLRRFDAGHDLRDERPEEFVEALLAAARHARLASTRQPRR